MPKKHKDPAMPMEYYKDVREDPSTGIYHLPVPEKDLIETIRGTSRLWWNPKMKQEYTDPVSAAYGGPEYVRNIPRALGYLQVKKGTAPPALPEYQHLVTARTPAHSAKLERQGEIDKMRAELDMYKAYMESVLKDKKDKEPYTGPGVRPALPHPDINRLLERDEAFLDAGPISPEEWSRRIMKERQVREEDILTGF